MSLHVGSRFASGVQDFTLINFNAVTSVRIASFLGLPVGPLRPLDRARSTS